VIGGITEQQLRDAWARWTERRPEELDWTTTIRVEAADPGTLGARGAQSFVWVVELADRSSPLGPRVLGTWPMGTAQAALSVGGDMILTNWVWERLQGR
jgi:hypothetical protein